MRPFRKIAAIASGLMLGFAVTDCALAPARAQESWNPFKQNDPGPPRRTRTEAATPAPAPPGDRDPGADRAGQWERPRPPSSTVERSDLDPVMAPDASGLPLDLWRGLDMQSLEGLLSTLDLPPRSPTLHQLWRRMLLSSATPPAGAPTVDHFLALRLEALYRSGLLGDMGDVLIPGGAASGPLVAALIARKDIGIGERDTGCLQIKTLALPASGLPGRLKGETQLLAGYCAAAAGDLSGAGLAAGLAREEGIDAELPLQVLAGVAEGIKPRLALPKRILLLDYRFLELLGPVNAAQIFDKSEPALLTALAGDAKADARVQVAAAEAALRLNALTPEAVADVYRRQSPSAAGLDAGAASTDPLLRRAFYFRAAELARAPGQRTRFLRALLDDARRSGLMPQIGRVAVPLLAEMQPTLDLASFAETAVEIALAGGQIAEARRWAVFGNGPQHWLALIDVVDPARRNWRAASLSAVEDVARRGGLSADALHRLATVLDALDIDVPVPLWEAASRSPQPASGYLPETGVLSDLAASAKRADAARTILLVMRTLGPNGPEGANILALGDAVRALKKIGLESDARRLGLEALLPVWPRTAAN